jgi:hypothetical protein
MAMWSQHGRDRFSRVVNAIAQASSIASFAWLLAPVVVAVAASVVAFALGHSWVGAFAGGAATMDLLLVVLLTYPLHKMLRRLFYGFRFTNVSVTLSIDENGSREHLREVALDARIVRPGIRRLPDRYCQPGPRAGDEAPRHRPRVVDGPGRVLDVLYDEAAGCWIYGIDLGGPLPAGTERSVRLHQELDFSRVEYEPWLQRTILDPTDHLRMCLRLPARYWPVSAWGEEGLPAERARKVDVVVDAEHHEIRMDLPKPRFGSIYRIRWAPVDHVSGAPTAALEPHHEPTQQLAVR